MPDENCISFLLPNLPSFLMNRYARTLFVDFGIVCFILGVFMLVTGVVFFSAFSVLLWIPAVAVMLLSLEMINKFSGRPAIKQSNPISPADAKRRNIGRFASRSIMVVGVALSVIALFLFVSVWVFGVSFTQSSCQGGESPVPVQGCGYVPYLVLYVWGESATLPLAIVISIIGSMLLLFRLFAFRDFRLISFRTLVALGLVAAVAFVSVASIFAASQINAELAPLSGAQYLQQCSVSWPPQPPGPNTTRLETLAAMTVNQSSTAQICMEYYSASSSPVSEILTGTAYYASNLTLVPNGTISFVADPQTIVAPAVQENGAYNPYAVFTLTTSSSSQGFYLISLTGMCTMPLAVGYTQINYSDFAYGLQHEGSCGTKAVSGGYVSVENVGVAYSFVPLADQ